MNSDVQIRPHTNSETRRIQQRLRKRGFVLVTILMILISIGVLAFTASFASRTSAATARNRVALSEARWRANGCIERVRAATHAAITAVSPEAVIPLWDSLDRVIQTSPLLTTTSCAIIARAAGAGLNINTASPEVLWRLFMNLNIPPTRADSLVDALMDWRDPDDLARPLGAEDSWYRSQKRLVPRNALFADPKELLSVRGFEQFGDTLSLLTTTLARIPLSHVPLPVLASLPGMTPEAVARAADVRMRKGRIAELLVLSANLPANARDSLMSNYATLVRQTTTEPERWIVTVSAAAGTPVVRFTTEISFARAGTRIAIMSRR